MTLKIGNPKRKGFSFQAYFVRGYVKLRCLFSFLAGSYQTRNKTIKTHGTLRWLITWLVPLQIPYFSPWKNNQGTSTAIILRLYLCMSSKKEKPVYKMIPRLFHYRMSQHPNFKKCKLHFQTLHPSPYSLVQSVARLRVYNIVENIIVSKSRIKMLYPQTWKSMKCLNMLAQLYVLGKSLQYNLI